MIHVTCIAHCIAKDIRGQFFKINELVLNRNKNVKIALSRTII